MKIALIGTGNVATHLGMALKKARHEIVCVYGRSLPAAAGLASKLKAKSFFIRAELIPPGADLYIISISDHAIRDFLKSFPHKKKPVVHTSGSVSMDVFSAAFTNAGVLYPLQTFSKNRNINLKHVPLLIEA